MLKSIICFLFLVITIGCVSSARILDEAVPQAQATGTSGFGAAAATNTLPSDQYPDTVPAPVDEVAEPPLPDTSAAPLAPVGDAPPVEDVAPVADVAPVVGVAPVDNAEPPATDAPVTTDIPAAPEVAPVIATPVAATGAAATGPGSDHPQLSFFMHDVIGGSHPTARVVTGIIANSEISSVPFSKVINNFFPVSGAVPLINGNNINRNSDFNGIVSNRNLPFLVGLSGAQVSTIIQNNGNNDQVNGGDNQPFVSAGQLPVGATLQKLMFGSITVFDDELTEGHELGSAVIGKAQGFYMASSLDGTSQTISMSVMLHGGDHKVDDTISFFGVHRSASHGSQIAIVGGTGKYQHAKGFATVETLPKVDQHTTDGVDTILQFDVYMTF